MALSTPCPPSEFKLSGICTTTFWKSWLTSLLANQQISNLAGIIFRTNCRVCQDSVDCMGQPLQLIYQIILTLSYRLGNTVISNSKAPHAATTLIETWKFPRTVAKFETLTVMNRRIWLTVKIQWPERWHLLLQPCW